MKKLYINCDYPCYMFTLKDLLKEFNADPNHLDFDEWLSDKYPDMISYKDWKKDPNGYIPWNMDEIAKRIDRTTLFDESVLLEIYYVKEYHDFIVFEAFTSTWTPILFYDSLGEAYGYMSERIYDLHRNHVPTF